MTWELANEPRPGADDSNNSVVHLFANGWTTPRDSFTTRIRTISSAPVSEGIQGCLDKPEDFVDRA